MIAAAQRREQQAKIEQAAATYGLPVRVDPLDALLGLLASAQGRVLWLQEEIRKLRPGALTWGPSMTVEKMATEFPGIDRTEAARIHGLIELHDRAEARLESVSDKLLKHNAGLREDERMRSLADRLMAAMRALAAFAGMDPRSPETTSVIVEILRTGEVPPPRELTS